MAELSSSQRTESRSRIMRLEISTRRIFDLGLLAIAALTFSFALALGNTSSARAQTDDGSAASAPADDQSNQADPSEAEAKAQADAVQQAHDQAEAADQALQSATDS